jgi:hypothetical protein
MITASIIALMMEAVSTPETSVYFNETKRYHLQIKVTINNNNTNYLLTPWRYSSCRTLAASHILCEVS